MNDPWDEFDRRLIDLLQQDADRTHEALAGLANLSPSAVQRRVARLKAAGAITGIVAVPSIPQSGIGFAALVELTLDSDRREVLEPLTRWVQAQPEVQCCWYVSGEADLVALVRCRDLDSFNSLMGALAQSHPSVVKYKTSLVFSTWKQSLALPLGD